MLICEANVSWCVYSVSTVIVCNGSYNIHKEEKGENRLKIILFSYQFMVKLHANNNSQTQMLNIIVGKFLV